MARDDDVEVQSDSNVVGYGRRNSSATDMHTVRSRDKLRKQMETEVERFLNSGGRIEHLPTHATGEQIATGPDQ